MPSVTVIPGTEDQDISYQLSKYIEESAEKYYPKTEVRKRVFGYLKIPER